MDKFFERIKNSKLRRLNNGFYSLGDSELDNGFGLGQDIATLTPSKDSIESLTAAAYFYGLLGYVPTEYTAVPAGYLITFKKEKETETLFVSIDKNAYYRERLIKLIDEKLYGPSSKDEKEVYWLASYLVEEDYPLILSAVAVSRKIKEYNLEDLNSNIDKAIKEFDCGIKDSVNSRNCENNHKLGASFCARYYFGQEYEEAPQEVQETSTEIFNEILDKWILPGYLTYVGRDRNCKPIEQNVQILNSPEHLKEFLKLEKEILSKKDINNARWVYKSENVLEDKNHLLSVLYNMCSTDYTADVVYATLNDIRNVESSQNVRGNLIDSDRKLVDKVISQTPSNNDQKSELRRQIRKSYNIQTEQEK